MVLKKQFYILAVLITICGISLAQTLTMVRPNDGGTFTIGESGRIVWMAESTSNTFKITLWQNDGFVGVIEESVPSGNGRRRYNWVTIGTLTTGIASAGTGYKIKIKERDSSRSCMSRVAFSLVSSTPTIPDVTMRSSIPRHHTPPIKVLFPNGGETLRRGGQYELKWEAIETFGRPRLIIKKGDSIEMNIPPERVSATKTSAGWHWTWIISTEISGGEGYKFRVENSLGRLWDESDAPFRIEASTQELTYTDPDDRTLFLTHQKVIRWRSNGLYSFKISLATLTGEQQITPVLPEDRITRNRYTWVVGQLFDRGEHLDTEEAFHKLRILGFDFLGRSLCFVESHPIDIQRPEMNVSIDPYSRDIHRGNRKTIRWRTSDLRGRVHVELWYERSPSYWVKFTTLADNARPNGSYSWHVYPDPGPGVSSLDNPPPINKKYKLRLVSTLVKYLYVESREFTLR